jgi:cbb3-type cytochrome oxidase subunit 1
MPRVSAAFFAMGALCVLMGMCWGIHMAMHQDFTLMPAHAHLNLVGWVTMSLFGTFYALTASTLSPRLAWANFVISGLGVIVMIPSLALMLSSDNAAKFEPFVATGSILTVIGLLVFGVSVVRELVRKR